MQIEDAKTFRLPPETSRLPPEGFSFDDDIYIELELDSNNLPDHLTHAHSTLF